MRESPRQRRLRSDFRDMQQLAAESSIVDFSYRAAGPEQPPDAYVVRFHGRGLERTASGRVTVREQHEVSIELGASYPRQMPELAWRTPIFHPNISASGIVCLGGYASHWVPSLTLPELCRMLWDMVRYTNYDVDSPYNREAASWARTQREWPLPVDERPIRDRAYSVTSLTRSIAGREPEVVFIDAKHRHAPPIVVAEVVPAAAQEDPDIVFIDAH